MDEMWMQQILEELKALKNGQEQLAKRLEKVENNMATKEELSEIRANMATKEELNEIRANMATKEELNEIRANMATKEELNEIRANMATKEELNEIRTSMATKEDVADIPYIKQAISEISDHVLQLRSDVQSLISSQARQDRILELLSIRSIELEAELVALRQERELSAENRR